MKLLSIVIVNYNSQAFVEEVLNSLFGKKGIPGSWEVFVVDNASSEKFTLSHSKYPGIHVIHNEKNIGFAKANNQAIKKSSGKYVALLNPDTIVSKETFTHLMEFMNNHDNVGIVSPKVLLPMGEIDDASHRGFPTPWRAFCYFSGLSKLLPNSQLLNGYHLGYKNMDKAHRIEACVGACMLIRREVGETIDWLDEDYFWYGEDLDFCYRVSEAGFEIWYVPEVSILHFKGVTSGIKDHSKNISTASRETKKKAQKARFEAMEIFYKKHYSKKYPTIVTRGVFLGINLLRKVHS